MNYFYLFPTESRVSLKSVSLIVSPEPILPSIEVMDIECNEAESPLPPEDIQIVPSDHATPSSSQVLVWFLSELILLFTNLSFKIALT